MNDLLKLKEYLYKNIKLSLYIFQGGNILFAKKRVFVECLFVKDQGKYYLHKNERIS